MPEVCLRRTSRELLTAFGPLSDAQDGLVDRITGALDERTLGETWAYCYADDRLSRPNEESACPCARRGDR
jgi:hypothetical protein